MLLKGKQGRQTGESPGDEGPYLWDGLAEDLVSDFQVVGRGKGYKWG